MPSCLMEGNRLRMDSLMHDRWRMVIHMEDSIALSDYIALSLPLLHCRYSTELSLQLSPLHCSVHTAGYHVLVEL